MREEIERLWNEDGKVGDVFKFDYDRLLQLMPTDIKLNKSDISSNKNSRVLDLGNMEEMKLSKSKQMTPKRKISSFSEIFEEEKSANRRAEISNESIRADPKFNAAHIFNSILERHNRQRNYDKILSGTGMKRISEGAKSLQSSD